MKKQKVIPNKYLPTKLPFNATTFHIFLLWFFSVPEWIFTVYIVLAALVWAACLKSIYEEDKDETLVVPDVADKIEISIDQISEFEKKIQALVNNANKNKP